MSKKKTRSNQSKESEKSGFSPLPKDDTSVIEVTLREKDHLSGSYKGRPYEQVYVRFFSEAAGYHTTRCIRFYTDDRKHPKNLSPDDLVEYERRRKEES